MKKILLGIALVLAASTISAQTTPSLSFTMSVGAAPTAGQVIPVLTWSTTPTASSCTASGDTAWTGTKSASGTQTLASVVPPKSYSLRCTWPGDNQATLRWTAPTTNTDGTALARCAASTDTGPCLAKYRIVRGATATALTESRDHNFPDSITATWSGLATGTHFFAVKSVTGQGVESALSNVISKVVTAPFEVTQSVGVRVPSAPTALTVE